MTRHSVAQERQVESIRAQLTLRSYPGRPFMGWWILGAVCVIASCK